MSNYIPKEGALVCSSCERNINEHHKTNCPLDLS